MKTLPPIGTRVRYRGGRVVGPCVGTIQKHFPDFDPDTLRERPFNPQQWHVSIEVEKLPKRWPYPGTRNFAPAVAEIEPLIA